MFLPVKADFKLARFPWLTALVCAVCLLVYLAQDRGWEQLEVATHKYCALERSHLQQIIFQRLASQNQLASCGDIMYYLANAPDQDAFIEELIADIKPLTGFNHRDSQDYVTGVLWEELQRYQRMVPDDPDAGLAYHTDSWNTLSMITASFAHGSWSHIGFNLVFFVAFAAAIEILAGPLAFFGAIVAISIFTGVFTSVSAIAAGQHFSSLGLSGVVMGMIGIFTYLMPRGNIRCYYWFIVIFGSVAVPAWALALWYVGGDIYRLFAYDDHGMVNVMAHVTGGIGGYLFGVLFLRGARQRAEGLQMELDFAARGARSG